MREDVRSEMTRYQTHMAGMLEASRVRRRNDLAQLLHIQRLNRMEDQDALLERFFELQAEATGR
jgi:hypothetical protein